MSYMEKVIQEFLVESYENLDQLDRDLVALEGDGNSRGRLDAIFRTIHTIKGTSVFLGFTRLETVSHVGENLLHRLREGEISMTSQLAEVLLSMVDTLRAIIGNIERTQQEGDIDIDMIVARLSLLLEKPPSPVASAVEAPRSIPSQPEETTCGEQMLSVAQSPDPAPVAPVEEACAMSMLHTNDPVEPMPEADCSDEHSARKEDLTRTEMPRGPAKEGVEATANVSDTTIRVDVALLDKLMNLVGELVLTRNQILQYTGGSADSALQSASQRLNLITTELQEGVMKTRMQPIGNI